MHTAETLDREADVDAARLSAAAWLPGWLGSRARAAFCAVLLRVGGQAVCRTLAGTPGSTLTAVFSHDLTAGRQFRRAPQRKRRRERLRELRSAGQKWPACALRVRQASRRSGWRRIPSA